LWNDFAIPVAMGVLDHPPYVHTFLSVTTTNNIGKIYKKQNNLINIKIFTR
jgi:hypothetical protein